MADVAGGQEQTDVAAHRAEEREVAHDFAVNALFEFVDAVVHAADLEGQGIVALLHRLEHHAGHVEGALAHEDEVIAELTEFVVEVALHVRVILERVTQLNRNGRRCRPRSGPGTGS
ncbi:MAG: hypothetical protein RL492_1463 [Verrucomicrobiota bacterium]